MSILSFKIQKSKTSYPHGKHKKRSAKMAAYSFGNSIDFTNWDIAFDETPIDVEANMPGPTYV